MDRAISPFFLELQREWPRWSAQPARQARSQSHPSQWYGQSPSRNGKFQFPETFRVKEQQEEGVEYCRRLGTSVAECVGRACRTSVEASTGGDGRERRLGSSAGYIGKSGERREKERRGCIGGESREERREKRR